MQAKSLCWPNCSSTLASIFLSVCLPATLANTCFDLFLGSSLVGAGAPSFLLAFSFLADWSNLDSVVVLIPGLEGRGIDEHDAVLHKGVGSDQLIVGGVVHDVDDSCLLGGGLAAPVEVALLDPEGPELVVASPDPHMPDPLVDLAGGEVELGVGDWPSLLVCSLLLVDGHPASRESLLVPGVPVDSHDTKYSNKPEYSLIFNLANINLPYASFVETKWKQPDIFLHPPLLIGLEGDYKHTMAFSEESVFLNLNRVYQHFEYQSLVQEEVVSGEVSNQKAVYEGMTQNTYLFVTERGILIKDIENISAFFIYKYVHPLPEVRANAVETFPLQKIKDRVCYIFQKYQEQPSLLDGILEGMITPIMNAVKLYLYKLLGSDEPVCEHFHTILGIIYQLTKVRGRKYTVKYFPHQVKDLQPAISYLVKSRDEGSNWETRYIIILWLTVIILVPFDLKTIDSKHIQIKNAKGENIEEMVELLLEISKYFLRATTKLKEAAAIFLSKLFTRPDIQKRHLLKEYVEYALANLKSLQEDQLNSFFLCGLYESLYQIFKNVGRSELLPFIDPILEEIRSESVNDKQSPAKKLIKIKLLTRIGLVYLKPRVAKWAYKKSKVSLKDNLKTGNSSKLVTNTASNVNSFGVANFGTDNQNQLQYYQDVNKQSLESIIDLLIEALSEKETSIREAASKGIGKIAGRLSPDMIIDLLDFIFDINPSPQTQHSVCLTLAELIRRNLLSPERLKALYPYIAESLLYEKEEGGYSIGQAVRDAACYMTWAVARGYEEGGKQLGIYLMIAACFDREVGCRRAASAAYQELVGRVGDVPNGIQILTEADYFTLGLQKNSYLNVGIFVASYQSYFQPFAQNLGYEKLRHWDTDIKKIAACSLSLMCPLNPQFMARQLLPSLVNYLSHDAMAVKLGSLIGIGELLMGLAGRSHQHQLHDQMKDSVFLRSLTQNDKKLMHAGEYMTLFKTHYEEVRYTNKVQLIDPAVQKRIIDTIKEFISKNLYKGKAGEAFRLATCRLLECIAIVDTPLDDQEKEIFNSFLEDNIKNPLEPILNTAVKCLKRFSASYHTSQTSKPFVNSLITNATLPTPQAKGYTLALSSLSRPVYLSHYTRVMTVIQQNCKILKEKEDDADRRKNSILVLRSMVETIGFEEATLNEDELKRIFELLGRTMNDYSTDKRGDIGSTVREASMKTLSRIVEVYCETNNRAVLLSNELVFNMVSSFLQQLSEKIDRIRLLAGSLLQRFFDYHNKHFAIPHGALLESIFKQDNIRQLIKSNQLKLDKVMEPEVMEMEMKIQQTIFHEKPQELIYYWNLPHCVFSVVVPLLRLREYSSFILKGLCTSAGGISESVIRYSRQELGAYVQSLSSNEEYQQMDYLVGDCVSILEKHFRNERVVVPMYHTLDFLLQKEEIINWEGLKSHSDRLASVLIKEIGKSKMILKISAGVGLFVHILALGQQEIKTKVLPYIVKYLSCDLPLVRKILVDRLLLVVMSQGEVQILDEGQSEELMVLLEENDFMDEKMDIKVMRQELSRILRTESGE